MRAVQCARGADSVGVGEGMSPRFAACEICGFNLVRSRRGRDGHKSCPNCSYQLGAHVFKPEHMYGHSEHRISNVNETGYMSWCMNCTGATKEENFYICDMTEVIAEQGKKERRKRRPANKPCKKCESLLRDYAGCKRYHEKSYAEYTYEEG